MSGPAVFSDRTPGAGPNFLLVVCDDLAFGDLSAHGNPLCRTPHLDRLAKEGVSAQRHYSGPLCSPARACLLTGRYNYRGGVVDTYCGRSILDPAETTLAELLAARGYRTGLFGKWHLGDTPPFRPEDRGFHETLWHCGGGIGQPGDHPDNAHRQSYFDPVLCRNGAATAAIFLPMKRSLSSSAIATSLGSPAWLTIPRTRLCRRMASPSSVWPGEAGPEILPPFMRWSRASIPMSDACWPPSRRPGCATAPWWFSPATMAPIRMCATATGTRASMPD